MADRPAVEVVRHVHATLAEVWPYLAEGRLWSLWQGVDAAVQAVVGGSYRMRMADGSEASGEVVEVVEHRRIVFTWGWTGAAFTLPPGSTVVEIDLEPVPGGTLIRLVHRDLPEHLRAPHEAGWTHYLGRLALLAEGSDPGPDLGPG